MKRGKNNVPGRKQDDYISIYKYKDIETYEDLDDGTTLVFVELKKFRKSFDECDNIREMWLSALTGMPGLVKIPEKAKGTELEDFFKTSELAALSSEERRLYEREVMSRNDQLNSIRETLAEGRKIAIEEGLQQGIQQGKIETAKKNKSLGVPLETIAEATGLTVKQIEEL